MNQTTEPAIVQLARFVRLSTEEFRKGARIEERGNVTEVYAMPHESEARTVTVDAGFITVGFTEHAAARDEFVRLLRAALDGPGEFQPLSVREFLGGPSYIATGEWIGSQDLALRLYALLEHYELATVVTPMSLGVEGEQARRAMGAGFVMFAPAAALRSALDAAAVSSS
jgi:hypothetical protein